MKEVEIKKIPVKRLEPNRGQIEGLPQNPRCIKDAKFKALVRSLKESPEMLNLRELIVYPYGERFVIIAGNMRYRAAQELNMEELPCKILPIDTLIEKLREYAIKDNNPYGEDDWDILANEWNEEELKGWDVDIDFFEKKKEIKDDEYEASSEINTSIKTGDLLAIGEHRLLCGDATNYSHVEKLMDNCVADLIFTDPPFDLENTILYTSNIFKIIKKNHHVFIMNSDKLLVEIVSNHIDLFRKFFAVDFRQARLVSNNQPMTRVDLIAEFVDGKTNFVNLHDGFSTLIECAKIHNNNNSINYGFNQAKRVELPSEFIQHYSKSLDVVVDLFGGSGSTMAASQQLGRRCFSMELEPRNCQIIINRMEEKYGLVAKKI